MVSDDDEKETLEWIAWPSYNPERSSTPLGGLWRSVERRWTCKHKRLPGAGARDGATADHRGHAQAIGPSCVNLGVSDMLG